MAKRGAPLGNKNNNDRKRGPIFLEALYRAIAQDDGERVRECAEKLLILAASGVPWATQMLAERLDGKVPQAISGLDGGPLTVQILKFSDVLDQVDGR
jgi:hypothetical protein